MLESLGRFVDTVKTSEDGKRNKTTLSFQMYAIQMEDVKVDEFKGQTFIANLGSVLEALNNTGKINTNNLITVKGDTEVTYNATASIMLQENSLNDSTAFTKEGNKTVDVSQRLSYLVFLTDILFQVSNQSRYAIGSIITSVRLGSASDVSLTTQINASFRINQDVSQFETTICKI